MMKLLSRIQKLYCQAVTYPAFFAFAVFLPTAAALWLYWFPRLASAESARDALRGLAVNQATFLAFMLALLGLALNMTAQQSQRLDELKEQFLQIFRSAGNLELDLTMLRDQYEAAARDTMALPSSFKCPRISHLDDRELLRYFPGLIHLSATAHRYEDTDSGSTKMYEVRSNSVIFFRVACGILLSDMCRSQEASASVRRIAEALNEMDTAYNVVRTSNNIYDIRRASKRGLPAFCFLLCGSWVFTIVALSTLSGSDFSRVVAGLAIAPVFLIAWSIAYYIHQILSRYV